MIFFIEAKTVGDAKKFLRALGGFPAASLTSQWAGPFSAFVNPISELSIQAMLEETFRYRLSAALFEIFVYTDMKSPTKNIIYVSKNKIKIKPTRILFDFFSLI